jgi:hypothetical protein
MNEIILKSDTLIFNPGLNWNPDSPYDLKIIKYLNKY